MITKFSLTARLILAISVLLFAAWYGFKHSHPWNILILGLVFTLLYIGGKWASWKLVLQNGHIFEAIKGVFITIPIQTLLAGVFYLIGLGVGKLTTTQSIASMITKQDFIHALLFLIFALGVVMIITLSEAKNRVSNGE